MVSLSCEGLRSALNPVRGKLKPKCIKGTTAVATPNFKWNYLNWRIVLVSHSFWRFKYSIYIGDFLSKKSSLEYLSGDTWVSARWHYTFLYGQLSSVMSLYGFWFMVWLHPFRLVDLSARWHYAFLFCQLSIITSLYGFWFMVWLSSFILLIYPIRVSFYSC